MTTADPILLALKQLDPAVDEHWTSDGSPRMEVVQKLTGNDGLKRADVVNAAPTFNRENPNLTLPPEGSTSTEGDAGQGTTSGPVPQDNEGDNGEGGEGEDGQAADADDDKDPAGPIAADLDPEDDPLPDLDAQVEAADAVLAEAQARLVEAQKVFDAAAKARDVVVLERYKEQDPNSNQMEIMSYLATQQAQREARAAGAAQLKDLGIDPKAFDPKSALDRSMARKTGFGHRPRPQLPAATEGAQS